MQWNIPISKHLQHGELNLEDKALVDRAIADLPNAYAPYSNFRVSAAIRLDNGSILSGCNQENSSFPVGICAERVVLSAVHASHPGSKVLSMAIVCNDGREGPLEPTAPCGMCRQALSDQVSRQSTGMRLILSTINGPTWVLNEATDLLPFRFDFKQ